MFRWILAAVAVVVAAVAISVVAYHHVAAGLHSFQRDPGAGALDRQSAGQYEAVSLVTLLANPERYDGRKLWVEGYVSLDFEEAAIHLDRVSYQAGLLKNALRLDPPKLTPDETRRLNHRYDQVAGMFRATDQFSHLYSGVLTDVRRIEPNFTRQEFLRWREREATRVLVQAIFSGWFVILVGWTGLACFWVIRRSRA